MKDEGCGIGTGLRPGGALIVGPGDGVPTGPPAAYGFVTKDVSDTIESMGSRNTGCLPERFEEGGNPGGSILRPCPFPCLGGDRCKGGEAGFRGSVLVMFIVVTGGWLWKRQKMW
jgi:hypothetical protein